MKILILKIIGLFVVYIIVLLILYPIKGFTEENVPIKLKHLVESIPGCECEISPEMAKYLTESKYGKGRVITLEDIE